MPAAERVLDFSDAAARLSLRHEQLVVTVEDREPLTVPMAEIAAVILAGPRLTATQPALAGLMRHAAAVIVCDESRQPSGMMLPINAHAMQTQRMLAQVRASVPTGKRLWKQIIQRKIRAQAAILDTTGRGESGLRALAREVRSGDTTNREGLASQRYWPLLFGDPDFRRRREADNQNRLLNYGYAVLRAAVGRAVCAAGLHPSIGVHHHGRTNPWCLADDLMEPYRPLVDLAVVELVGRYPSVCPLDAEAKGRLVAVLTDRLESDGESRTVSDWIQRTAASLAQVFLGETDRLFYPKGLTHGDGASS